MPAFAQVTASPSLADTRYASYSTMSRRHRTSLFQPESQRLLHSRNIPAIRSRTSKVPHPLPFLDSSSQPPTNHISYVTPIPDSLPSADAAPMLCAGVTTYTALRKSGAQSGQWVVISGAGGGLGHIAVQIASKGMALRVIGIDAGPKEKVVLDSGAEHFIDIMAHDDASIEAEVKKLTGGLGASAVIVCTASNKAYAQGMNLLRFSGTLVCVGMPEGELQGIATTYPSVMVAKDTRVVASAVGNRKDAIETLDLAARGVVKVHHRVEKMEKLTEVR